MKMDHILARKSLRMIEAASLSTRSRVSRRVTPRPHRFALAAYDVTRSSCRYTGTSSESENLRAMSRAVADITLSSPVDSSGKPITSALASNSASMVLTVASNFFQLSSVTTSSGLVVIRSSSQMATPTRFVPGSSANIRPADGTFERSVKSAGLVVSFSCTDSFNNG